MSIIDQQKLMFANMMLSGGLPMVSALLKGSPQFKALKQLRIDALAQRAAMKAKIDEVQRKANEQIDALQADMDRRLEELDQAAERLFSDAGLEDLFEALRAPEPEPASPAAVKPSSVHVLTRPVELTQAE